MNCEVCCEEMKKPITCNMCDYTTCYKCASRFILECTIMPKCMKCEKPWSRKHLIDGFGQYFVSHKYKAKRENVLFELEKALLPATQPHAAKQKMLKEIAKQESVVMNKIRKTINERDVEMSTLNMYEDEYLVARKRYNMELHSMREDLANLNTMSQRIMYKKQKDEKKPNSIYVKCPNETCRGFIDSKMKCDLCNTKLCKSCHVVVTDEEHVCNREDVETVRILFANTKNCPSCKALIFKIDGCDQMFCTQCHTAFSWKTCEIVNGRIHNPHYYEYLRRAGNVIREVGDIPCGGIPDIRHITYKFGVSSLLSNIHRTCTHIQYAELPMYNVNNVQDNRDLRIKYLNNEISLEVFKTDLQRREKSRDKKREISTILNTFLVVCSDVFRTALENKNMSINEFDSIRTYTNELLGDVSRVFKCVVPMILDSWEVTRARHD